MFCFRTRLKHLLRVIHLGERALSGNYVLFKEDIKPSSFNNERLNPRGKKQISTPRGFTAITLLGMTCS